MSSVESKTREIMNKYNIRPNKKFGQNFLVEQDVLDSIIAAGEVCEDDLVIEIGPGLGVLTAELCKKAGKVIAVELDRKFIDILEDVLANYNNYRIIQGDILALDLKALLGEENHNGNVKIIANLPYYITTPVIMKLLEDELDLKSIVVMVQKEVAERITAGPGGKEYGALTIAVAYYGLPEIVTNVPAKSFVPRPEVDSSVIRIDVYKNPVIDVKDKAIFFNTVRASFSQRRKTILNVLNNSGLFKVDKKKLKEILEELGIEEMRRPETLSIHEFACLADKISEGRST